MMEKTEFRKLGCWLGERGRVLDTNKHKQEILDENGNGRSAEDKAVATPRAMEKKNPIREQIPC